MRITVTFTTRDGTTHQTAEQAVNHGTALDICERLGVSPEQATVAALVQELRERDAVLEQLAAVNAAFQPVPPAQA